MKVALWRLYISGRDGFEKELGHVIASATDFDWLTKHLLPLCPHLACDIVKQWTI